MLLQTGHATRTADPDSWTNSASWKNSHSPVPFQMRYLSFSTLSEIASDHLRSGPLVLFEAAHNVYFRGLKKL
jgi:hypothetical protein